MEKIAEFEAPQRKEEICPVCKTVQLTYKVEGQPNSLCLVDHAHNGRKCEVSHRGL